MSAKMGVINITAFFGRAECSMSTLVNYSSEDEQEEAGKTASTQQAPKHKDVNYDDVNMEMSEDENEDQEAAMFSSKEDYQAYKEQFAEKSSNSPKHDRHKSRQKPDKGTFGEHRRRKNSPDGGSRRSRHEDYDEDDRRRRRRKSRSRSRERSHRKRRSRSRSRSRSRERHRRHRDRPRSHQDHHRDSRNRKLQSLGLISGKSEGQTYESQLEKVKELTGVEVPKYYNPHTINPLKYAEQIKKRQMLWSKKEDAQGSDPSEAVTTPPSQPFQAITAEPLPGHCPTASSSTSNTSVASATSFNKWEATNFGNDKTNEKFRRLMGIKGGSSSTTTATFSAAPERPQNDQKWFADQEQQYERARAITHTQRGLGLGFGSALQPPANSLPAPNDAFGKRPPSFVKKQ